MHIDNEKISIHHVGGRGGRGGLPINPIFEKDFINVFYDADSRCIEQINHLKLSSEAHVFPYCLSDKHKKALFHLNYDPPTSSLLKLNQEYGDFYLFNWLSDYVLSDVVRPQENEHIDAFSLDYLYSEGKLSVSMPDFLCLDTQGTEYDILRGAEKIVRHTALAIRTEVEFEPLYKGQRLFGDISKWLQERGFYFVSFLSLQEFSPVRMPIGLRAKGFNVASDALFLKKISFIENMNIDNEQRFLMLRKLAFIAITFHLFEYGLKCLISSRKYIEQNDTKCADMEKRTYPRFLNRIEKAVENVPLFYPPKFSSKYTFQETKERFELEKEWIFKDISHKKIEHLSAISEDSEIESVLRDFNMEELSEIIKRKRVYDTVNVLWANGYLQENNLVTDYHRAIEKYIREQIVDPLL